MSVARSSSRPRRQAAARAALSEERIGRAFERLARQQALLTLVRGALPPQHTRRLLKDSMPARIAREMPDEVWSSLAASIALASPSFGVPLAHELHDRLAWDREPPDLDAWWALVRDKPLEALWMAALSENRAVRKEFVHVASHCIENFRNSPECPPPSWEYVDGLLEVQGKTAGSLKEAERLTEDAERRYQVERGRVEELREELKRLRRENAELRAARAGAERRAEALETQTRAAPVSEEARRVEELERKLRKADKEREHLLREIERLEPKRSAETASAAAPAPAEPAPPSEVQARAPSLSEDPNPRRRVVRQMLRKLFKKGKIGASHTHEDNVYRGVVDHEKGIAKEAIELLYREGLLMPKPTATDPHVSLATERVAEIKAIIAGEIENPRLRRFVGA